MNNWTIKKRVVSIIVFATVVAVVLSVISIIDINALDGITSKLIVSTTLITLLVAYGLYSIVAINRK